MVGQPTPDGLLRGTIDPTDLLARILLVDESAIETSDGRKIGVSSSLLGEPESRVLYDGTGREGEEWFFPPSGISYWVNTSHAIESMSAYLPRRFGIWTWELELAVAVIGSAEDQVTAEPDGGDKFEYIRDVQGDKVDVESAYWLIYAAFGVRYHRTCAEAECGIDLVVVQHPFGGKDKRGVYDGFNPIRIGSIQVDIEAVFGEGTTSTIEIDGESYPITVYSPTDPYEKPFGVQYENASDGSRAARFFLNYGS